jgi:GDP-L-fucose synthase
MNKTDKIYVAGHRGLVGSAILRSLNSKVFTDIITRTHNELYLLDQKFVNAFFQAEKPDYVFLAAAKVGGIGGNANFPAEFIYQNTLIGFNVVHASYVNGVKKLMNLGSTCIYPKLVTQPIIEESLLTGPLEPTNDAYALAKISVIKLCTSYNKQYGTNFLSVMPTNLYGLWDTYDTETGHVLPSMIRKFHEAKITNRSEVTLWGDGSPLREFLYSDDLAQAVVYLMEKYSAKDIRNTAGDFINIGSGEELTIKNLAEMIRGVIFEEELLLNPEKPADEICYIHWDSAKPNGTPRKLCDTSRLASLGFIAKTSLKDGIKKTYSDFVSRYISSHGDVLQNPFLG